MEELEQLRGGLEGRYAVDRQIGSGGMARVYLAEDLKHGRAVVVKVLRSELAAALGRERFLREIQTAARLQHPHILPVYDSGEADGLLYYVMPYVPEDSLRDRLDQERQLALPEVLRITGNVAAALDFAHASGLVHRDIKPENILLRSGTAVVSDFGIARAVEEAADGRLTEVGVGLGTPTYASPEQIMGEATVDGRSDVYSLGCLVFEMLVGSLPFAAPTALGVLVRKTTELPPPLIVSGASLPPGVEVAIRRALDREPGGRFATAGEFAAALETAARMAPSSSDGRPRALAVLPFENLSGDPANEYLSDGISEALIHALGGVAGLRVIARTSSFAFRGTRDSIRTIAGRLNVDTVLEGSVQRSGNRLRVMVRLVEAQTEAERWSERYDRTMDDVFAMQDEIAASVVRTVTGVEDQKREQGTPTADVAAYEAYLQGRLFWNLRTETALFRGIASMTAAVERDPRFALAHAGLADLYVTLALYGTMAPGEAAPKALAAARQALDIGGAEAEALTARGCVRAIHEWRFDAAAADFERAIELKPQYARAYQWYAINCLAPQGKLAEAAARLATAQEFDPLSPAISVSRGLVHHFQGEDHVALRTYDRVLEADSHYAIGHFFRGRSLVELGRLDEALAALTRATELSGQSSETVAALGHALGRAGQRQRALEIREQLAVRGRERYVSPVLLALVDAGLGDTDGAFEQLGRAVAGRAVELIWVPVRPSFRALWSDPRFAALAAALNPRA